MDFTTAVNNIIENGRIPEGAFAQDENLTSIVIPEGVEEIGEVAFYGCPNLKEVIFPKSLKYIREEAFGETPIREAILPEGLEEIEEKAFFSCEDLRKIEVPGIDTMIGEDAFGCCDELIEGYIACGYPAEIRQHEELQYTLLWCSCPDRHTEKTSEHAKKFIRANEKLIMEWIIRHNNIPAMNGIAGCGLLEGDINEYIIQANEESRHEITALLMSLPQKSYRGDFDL